MKDLTHTAVVLATALLVVGCHRAAPSKGGNDAETIVAADDDNNREAAEGTGRKASTDHETIQGTWYPHSVLSSGEPRTFDPNDRLIFAAGKGTWRIQGTPGEFKCVLDATKKPKEIDLTFREKGKTEPFTLTGIYSLQADSLTLCLTFNAPGQSHPRPSEFATSKDEEWTALFVFKRVKVDASEIAQPPGPKRAAVIMFLPRADDSPYWKAVQARARQAVDELKLADAGLRIVIDVDDFLPRQLDLLESYEYGPGIAAVALPGGLAERLEPALRELRKQGIPVVCIDRDVDSEKSPDLRDYFVGTDNLTAGRVLGTAVKKLLEARNVRGGSYAQFGSETAAQVSSARMDGFKQGVGENYREACRTNDDAALGINHKLHDNIDDALSKHEDLVAMVGSCWYHAPYIARALRGKRHAITVAGIGLESIDRLHSGEIDVLVVQRPYDIGYQAVRLLKALCQEDQETVRRMFPNAGANGGDRHDTGVKVIVPDDSPLEAEMFGEFGEEAQFMSVTEFEKHLDEHGYKGTDVDADVPENLATPAEPTPPEPETDVDADAPENLLATPKDSFRYQIKLLKAGDVEKLKLCFTERLRDVITSENVQEGRKQIETYSLEDVYASEQMGEYEGQKTCKVKMANGRTLTTFVLVDGKWLADTVRFR